MESRVLKKLSSTRARKGTRHWDYGTDYDPTREKKAIDPKKVMDVDAEADDFAAAVMPEIENVYATFGEGVTQSFGLAWNLRDPEMAKDLLQRSNRLRGTVDTTWHAVQEAILDGEAEGDTIDGIAKRIGRVFQQAKGYRARVIARTETIGAANAGAFRGAVQTGVVEKKVWLAAVDHRTRSSHVTADGQAVALDRKFQVGAASMAHPGDPAGGASEVINCRCTMMFERLPAEDLPEDVDLDDDAPEVVGIDGQDVTPIRAKTQGNAQATSSIGKRVLSGSKPNARKPGKPIGPGTKVAKGVDKARAAIEKVHAAPKGMAEIDVYQSSSPTTLGSYNFRYSGEASHMAISSAKAEQATTFVHEFGHYFDHQDFGSAGSFSSTAATKGEGPLAAWWEAVIETDTYKAIEKMARTVGRDAKVDFVLPDGRIVEVFPDTAFGRYLLDPREVWARTYAQFVAKESGDPDLWDEMAQLIQGREAAATNPRSGVFPTQWPEDEFEDIAATMRTIFKEEGLAE